VTFCHKLHRGILPGISLGILPGILLGIVKDLKHLKAL